MIVAVALAGAFVGVRLGLAAVPLLRRVMERASWPIEWEGVE